MPLVNLLPQFEFTGADACDDAAVDEQVGSPPSTTMWTCPLPKKLAGNTPSFTALSNAQPFPCSIITAKLSFFFYSQNDVTIRNTVATASRTACATSRHRPAIPPGGAHGYAERSTSPGILWIIHEKLFMPLQNDGLFVEKW